MIKLHQIIVVIALSAYVCPLLADIPYLPPYREGACKGKRPGDTCVAKRSPEIYGTCVVEDQLLVCVEHTEKALLNSAHHEDAVAVTTGKKENLPLEKNAAKKDASGDVPVPEGCNNAPYSSGIISLISVLIGLIMLKKT
jgi:hypothetical protein